MLEIYYIEEFSEGTFPLSFNLIDRYKKEEPFLTEKLNAQNIQRFLFAEAGVL